MRFRIRELRKARGLTVQALADMIHVSKSHLSEMELGKKNVSSRHLDPLAAALGCEPVDLIDPSSADPEILEHIRTVSSLTPENRAAVIRHAEGLRLQQGKDDSLEGAG